MSQVLSGGWPVVADLGWVVYISEVIFVVSVFFVDWLLWLGGSLILSIIRWSYQTVSVSGLLVLWKLVVTLPRVGTPLSILV